MQDSGSAGTRGGGQPVADDVGRTARCLASDAVPESDEKARMPRNVVTRGGIPCRAVLTRTVDLRQDNHIAERQ